MGALKNVGWSAICSGVLHEINRVNINVSIKLFAYNRSGDGISHGKPAYHWFCVDFNVNVDVVYVLYLLHVIGDRAHLEMDVNNSHCHLPRKHRYTPTYSE